MQFKGHFLKTEGAAAFWLETSIAGACTRKHTLYKICNIAINDKVDQCECFHCILWGANKDRTDKNLFITQTTEKFYTDLITQGNNIPDPITLCNGVSYNSFANAVCSMVSWIQVSVTLV